MHIDENPLFRKAIVPWYDSEAACLVTVILMESVFVLGVFGLSVVRETPEFHRYVWFPVTLMALSFAAVLSITIRLFRRYAHRRKKRQGQSDYISIGRR
ncbi:hypothetical protein [Desulfococcus sp.]|uniref:hypothetical protein n=1 Tax=Desulfococcus sp. TaxID=2025834 RepID=UPI00359324AE